MLKRTCTLIAALALVAGCTMTPTADYCAAPLSGSLESAIDDAQSRLANGCEYHFDGYFEQLLVIAEANPDPENKRLFSDHLVHVSDDALISKRQAKLLYNRYFNVKFVSLAGDYNTCAQTCPVRAQVLADMKAELRDKELGLLHASQDRQSFYRADKLLKETELVLEATCRACSAGGASR
jgi:hypothetical protein